MAEEVRIPREELDLALEKAYRRGFHQALTLLATFYPHGVRGSDLVRLANEHMIWFRESTGSYLVNDAHLNPVSPLEEHNWSVTSR
jgi:hypothetical protein